MSIIDAYAELGLNPGASDAEVKAAWRRMVSQWHPDRNASAEAAALMQRINAAYERIRVASESAVADDAEAPAADRRVEQRRVRLSIEEAVAGCTRTLRGRLVDACTVCEGHGTRGEPLSCTTCKGSGRNASAWWQTWPLTSTDCTDCQGTGLRPHTCPACDGKGQWRRAYRCTVQLPAGLRPGDLLHADGGGSQRGGFDGTLELRVELAAHPLFKIGDDGTLRSEFPVDGFAWLLEAWIEVPAPSGLQQMRLRRGRLVYRLAGQGLPLEHDSSQRGDYVVTVTPTFPDVPDDEQQALLRRLATLADTQPPAALHAWRQRLQTWKNGRKTAP